MRIKVYKSLSEVIAAAAAAGMFAQNTFWHNKYEPHCSRPVFLHQLHRISYYLLQLVQGYTLQLNSPSSSSSSWVEKREFPCIVIIHVFWGTENEYDLGMIMAEFYVCMTELMNAKFKLILEISPVWVVDEPLDFCSES